MATVERAQGGAPSKPSKPSKEKPNPEAEKRDARRLAFTDWLKANGYDPTRWHEIHPVHQDLLKRTYLSFGGSEESLNGFVLGNVTARAAKGEFGSPVADTAAPPAPIDEIDLFDDFVPDIFAPESTDIMDEKIHAIAKQILGRRLRPDELANAQARYREAERKRFQSGSALGRRQHEIARFQAIAEQLLAAATARLATEHPEWAPEQLYAEAQKDSSYQAMIRKAKQKTTNPYTEYGDEEAAFDVASAVGSASPLEELGVQVRSAAEGLVKAIGRGGYRGP